MGSLLLSIMAYRSERPRVSVATHLFSIHDDEFWLQVRLANAGRGEIDLDGATCDLMGPTGTNLPYRLKAAASYLLLFRAPLSEVLTRTGSVTVNVGLGNGRSLVAQVQLTDEEQATLRTALQAILPLVRNTRPPTEVPSPRWLPPTQEEV